MKFLKWLLFPFSCLYGSIMAIRNFCYDQGILTTRKFDLPVISVGNLTVGGTGKTPHVEYLLRLLQGYQTATLSRGYKRLTKGFLLAKSGESALTLGDEPFQYFLDFPETTVAVCENRVTGIENIVFAKPETEIIILDDAFQHRAVTPGLNLLITDFYRRFDNDFMLPTGLLREPRGGARRADTVLVSKCPPELSAGQQAEIKKQISRYTQPGTPVYFTTFQYGEMVGFGSKKVPANNIVLVTGIANPEPLVRHLGQNQVNVLSQITFPDHHVYTQTDLVRIGKILAAINKPDTILLTTRKDAVKLMAPELQAQVCQLPFFYLPIEVGFLAGRQEFEAQVQQLVAGRFR